MNKDDVEYDDYDEWCDPKKPRMIKAEDILAAAKRLAGQIVRTSFSKAHMSARLGMDLYLKHEFLQYTGSLKERGVRNALLLLPGESKKRGVITASTGNLGMAMAYHAKKLGIPCIVVMPINASNIKVTKCEIYGAKTILYGDNLCCSQRRALTVSKEKNITYINGYDHPNVIEGQGTIALEMLEQVPTLDAFVVPVGGGAALAGIATIAKHLKPDIEVYGVCTDKTMSMLESLKKNERTQVVIDSTIADGLAVTMVGVNAFHTARAKIDKVVPVKEDWVARAIMHIVEEERFVVEGAAATGVAALLAGLLPDLKGKKVAAILTGGNIDTTILARALERGLAAEGRLFKFKVTVSDRVGGMEDVCAVLAKVGVSLRDCVPERAWVQDDVFSCALKLIVETRGWDHLKELMELIKKKYKTYYFPELSEDESRMKEESLKNIAPDILLPKILKKKNWN